MNSATFLGSDGSYSRLYSAQSLGWPLAQLSQQCVCVAIPAALRMYTLKTTTHPILMVMTLASDILEPEGQTNPAPCSAEGPGPREGRPRVGALRPRVRGNQAQAELRPKGRWRILGGIRCVPGGPRLGPCRAASLSSWSLRHTGPGTANPGGGGSSWAQAWAFKPGVPSTNTKS